jgi:hypothetical protein
MLTDTNYIQLYYDKGKGDTSTAGLTTRERVIIEAAKKGYMMSFDASDEVLELATGVVPVDIIQVIGEHDEEIPEKLYRYCTVTFTSDVYLNNLTGKYCVQAKRQINQYLVDIHWREVKTTRDDILTSTDWTTSTTILTKEVVANFKAYRELIRDVVRVAEYPCDVVFPPIPKINSGDYTATIRKKLTSSRKTLTDTLIENIITYLPSEDNIDDWNKILSMWKEMNFINDFTILDNLIRSYSDLTLKDIINSTAND